MKESRDVVEDFKQGKINWNALGIKPDTSELNLQFNGPLSKPVFLVMLKPARSNRLTLPFGALRLFH